MKFLKFALAVSTLAMATMIGSAVGQNTPGKDHNHGMTFMATALDLTDAQVAQIQQIRSANRADFHANHQQMKSLHEQLRAVITADTFDEAKAQSLISQVQQLQAGQMLEHAREMNAIYKVLTPQQKAKAVKLFGNMEFGGMHGHRGPGSGSSPAPQQD